MINSNKKRLIGWNYRVFVSFKEIYTIKPSWAGHNLIFEGSDFGRLL